MPSLSCPQIAPTLRGCAKTPYTPGSQGSGGSLSQASQFGSKREGMKGCRGIPRGGADGEEIRQFITDSFHDSNLLFSLVCAQGKAGTCCRPL